MPTLGFRVPTTRAHCPAYLAVLDIDMISVSTDGPTDLVVLKCVSPCVTVCVSSDSGGGYLMVTLRLAAASVRQQRGTSSLVYRGLSPSPLFRQPEASGYKCGATTSSLVYRGLNPSSLFRQPEVSSCKFGATAPCMWCFFALPAT